MQSRELLSFLLLNRQFDIIESFLEYKRVTGIIKECGIDVAEEELREFNDRLQKQMETFDAAENHKWLSACGLSEKEFRELIEAHLKRGKAP